MNTYFSIEVKSAGTPVTGLTSANIKFRISPYGAGNLVAETITVTEIGYGVYICYGFTVYQPVKLFINDVEQTWFGIQKAGIDSNGIVLLTGNQTVAGVKTFSSSPIVPAATLTGQAMRFDETVRTTSNQTVTGNKTFSGVTTLGNGTAANLPISPDDEVTGHPPVLNDEHQFVHLYHLTSVIGSAIGMVQDEYTVMCIPLYTGSSRFAKISIVKCTEYLAALANITTYRGLIECKSAQTTNNNFAVDSSATAWISNGIDIIGYNKPRITRAGYNSSLTSDSKITNCYIYEPATAPVAARSYTNFTFQDCDFNISADMDITFTNCQFLGDCRIRTNGGETMTLANCYGTGKVTTNGTFVFSGTKRPMDCVDGQSTDVLGI